MSKTEIYHELQDYFDKALKENKNLHFITLASELVNALREKFPLMDWVGFYLYDPEKAVLYLGPYSSGLGACEQIAPGKGVCGTCFEERKTQLVTDTSKMKNYIACASSTKSEIVVPLLGQEGGVYAVLDIDSDTKKAFDKEDVAGLESLCWLISQKGN